MIYINGRFLTQQLTGVQRFAFQMVSRLIKTDGDLFCVLVPPKDIDNSFGLVNWPIKVIGKRKTAIWELIDLQLFLNKNNKPLLINLINTAPLFYKNQIVTIHDMTTFINKKWFSKVFAHYYQFVIPIIAKNALKIITVSNNSKLDIIKFINVNPAKIEVVNCGVSDQFITKQNSYNDVDSVLKKLDLLTTNYILAVSSLDPRKNFKRLIQAYNLAGISTPLVIVGSEGKVFANDDLRSLISNNKNILFTGYLSEEDLVKLYQCAICFVYPSLYEGFGMPPLEAMACGCPTIVSDNSSLPEVCGDASLYIDPENVDSIKNAIIELTSNAALRLKLIKLGTKQAEKFTWDHSALKLSEIIYNIKK